MSLLVDYDNILRALRVLEIKSVAVGSGEPFAGIKKSHVSWFEPKILPGVRHSPDHNWKDMYNVSQRF